MPGFTDEDELRRYVGGIFEVAMADPELGPKLAGTGLVLALRCTEPDSGLVLDLPGGVVHQGLDAGPPPSATMTMSTDTANRYWQGTVNLTFAMARRTVTVDGGVTRLLQLAPLSKRLFPRYVEQLRADGREDLLVAR